MNGRRTDDPGSSRWTPTSPLRIFREPGSAREVGPLEGGNMRRTRWIVIGGCTGLLLLAGGSVLAKDRPAGAGTQPATGDREFLTRALGVNELELQLGRVAAERSSTPELRAKAQKMVDNHTKLGRQLHDLAQQEGLTGEPALSAEQSKMLAKVKSQPASDFDAVFKQTVDSGHVEELAMYRSEVSRAANPQLRELAEQRVASLEQAVSAAQQPASGMGSGGR
jgi:putative membrane protein